MSLFAFSTFTYNIFHGKTKNYDIKIHGKCSNVFNFYVKFKDVLNLIISKYWLYMLKKNPLFCFSKAFAYFLNILNHLPKSHGFYVLIMVFFLKRRRVYSLLTLNKEVNKFYVSSNISILLTFSQNIRLVNSRYFRKCSKNPHKGFLSKSRVKFFVPV